MKSVRRRKNRASLACALSTGGLHNTTEAKVMLSSTTTYRARSWRDRISTKLADWCSARWVSVFNHRMWSLFGERCAAEMDIEASSSRRSG